MNFLQILYPQIYNFSNQRERRNQTEFSKLEIIFLRFLRIFGDRATRQPLVGGGHAVQLVPGRHEHELRLPDRAHGHGRVDARGEEVSRPLRRSAARGALRRQLAALLLLRGNDRRPVAGRPQVRNVLRNRLGSREGWESVLVRK